MSRDDPPALLRAVTVACALMATLYFGWSCAPNPRAIQVPGVADYHDLTVARAQSPGFVQRILVQDGQLVSEGEALVELRNDEVESERATLRCLLAQCCLRQRMAQEAHQIATAQIESRNEQALREQLTQKQKQCDSLIVRAQRSGRVLAPHIHRQMGRYFKPGDEIVAIGHESKKELILSIGHDDVQEALADVGEKVQIRLGSRRRIQGVLRSVEPRASLHLINPALAASAGGDLPVHETVSTDGTTSLELVEPRFRAIVSLDPASAHDVRSGERGYASFGWRSSSIGADVQRAVRNWVDAKRQ